MLAFGISVVLQHVLDLQKPLGEGDVKDSGDWPVARLSS